MDYIYKRLKVLDEELTTIENVLEETLPGTPEYEDLFKLREAYAKEALELIKELDHVDIEGAKNSTERLKVHSSTFNNILKIAGVAALTKFITMDVEEKKIVVSKTFGPIVNAIYRLFG